LLLNVDNHLYDIECNALSALKMKAGYESEVAASTGDISEEQVLYDRATFDNPAKTRFQDPAYNSDTNRPSPRKRIKHMTYQPSTQNASITFGTQNMEDPYPIPFSLQVKGDKIRFRTQVWQLECGLRAGSYTYFENDEVQKILKLSTLEAMKVSAVIRSAIEDLPRTLTRISNEQEASNLAMEKAAELASQLNAPDTPVIAAQLIRLIDTYIESTNRDSIPTIQAVRLAIHRADAFAKILPILNLPEDEIKKEIQLLGDHIKPYLSPQGPRQTFLNYIQSYLLNSKADNSLAKLTYKLFLPSLIRELLGPGGLVFFSATKYNAYV